jgi:hypothetical protein
MIQALLQEAKEDKTDTFTDVGLHFRLFHFFRFLNSLFQFKKQFPLVDPTQQQAGPSQRTRRAHIEQVQSVSAPLPPTTKATVKQKSGMLDSKAIWAILEDAKGKGKARDMSVLDDGDSDYGAGESISTMFMRRNSPSKGRYQNGSMDSASVSSMRSITPMKRSASAVDTSSRKKPRLDPEVLPPTTNGRSLRPRAQLEEVCPFYINH